MPAAYYGVEDMLVTWSPATGGSNSLTGLLDMDSPLNVKISATIDEWRAAGVAWTKRDDSQSRTIEPLVLSFVYAPGAAVDLAALFYGTGSLLGTKGTLLITWGGAKTTSVPAIIMDYERLPSTDKQTRCKVTLGPDGAPTDA